MRNRLEAMVGYLADREGEAAPTIRAELGDPTSEASRFLEATRRRTRALVQEQPVADQAPSTPLTLAIRPGFRRAVPVAGLAASVLLAAAASLGLGEARVRRMEEAMARREAESRSEARRLEDALARAIPIPGKSAPVPSPASTPTAPPMPRIGPIEVALARVESGLGKLERRIDGIDLPGPGPAPPAPEPTPVGADPAIVEIRRDLAALRRELVASDQAGARQVMELRLGLQEVGNLLRMALSRPPVMIPVPGPNGGQNFPNVQPNALSPQIMGLVGNLGSSHHQARLEAAQQLARMGQSAQGALPSLQQMLQHEADARVRAAVQAAISAIGPE